MSRILRYELQGTDAQRVTVPAGYKILSVAPGRTGYHIDLWAKVPSNWVAESEVTIQVFGTGHPIPDTANALEFIGTCVMDDGLVWHVFEEVLF